MPAPRPFYDPEPCPTLPSGGSTFVRRRGLIDWATEEESVRFLVNFPWFRLKAETEGLIETKGGDWLVRLQLDGFVTGLSIGNPNGVPIVSGYVDSDEGGGARLRLRNVRLELKAWHAERHYGRRAARSPFGGTPDATKTSRRGSNASSGLIKAGSVRIGPLSSPSSISLGVKSRIPAHIYSDAPKALSPLLICFR